MYTIASNIFLQYYLTHRLSECVSVYHECGHLTLRVDGLVRVGQLHEGIANRNRERSMGQNGKMKRKTREKQEKERQNTAKLLLRPAPLHPSADAPLCIRSRYPSGPELEIKKPSHSDNTVHSRSSLTYPHPPGAGAPEIRKEYWLQVRREKREIAQALLETCKEQTPLPS